jgi:hypothetical protein
MEEYTGSKIKCTKRTRRIYRRELKYATDKGIACVKTLQNLIRYINKLERSGLA